MLKTTNPENTTKENEPNFNYDKNYDGGNTQNNYKDQKENYQLSRNIFY